MTPIDTEWVILHRDEADDIFALAVVTEDRTPAEQLRLQDLGLFLDLAAEGTPAADFAHYSWRACEGEHVRQP